MNQADLIAAVAERAGLTKADAGKAVEALVGTITEALKQGDEVRIAGFGSFGISERGERQGRVHRAAAKARSSRPAAFHQRLGAFSSTASTRTPSRSASATRQLPAPGVWPVFRPIAPG